MPQFFGVKKLERLSDWIPIVSRANWKRRHSAYELAHSWHMAKGFPPMVARVIASAKSPLLRGLRLRYCLVEKPVFLDTLKAPSWTDVMAYCRNAEEQTVIIATEGKAKEVFARKIVDWVRDREEGETEGTPKGSRVRRLDYLSDVLNIRIDSESPLRYQLVHRTVSAIIETQLHSGVAAMLLIHSFDDSKIGNWHDYQAFLEALGLGDPRKNLVQGPLDLGPSRGVPTFFAWVSDKATK